MRISEKTSLKLFYAIKLKKYAKFKVSNDVILDCNVWPSRAKSSIGYGRFEMHIQK